MAKLYFYYSTMNAGKSTTLLQSAYNYQERGMNTLIYTAAIDDRFGIGKVTSRIGIDREARLFQPESDLWAEISDHIRQYKLHCILVDDMIDTGGTLCKAAEALKERGAKRVFAYATHPVFSGSAVKNIANDALDEIVVTDTIPLSKEINALGKVRALTLSGMLAEAIRRISNEESISAMFN